jgi:hypothetical protein
VQFAAVVSEQQQQQVAAAAHGDTSFPSSPSAQPPMTSGEPDAAGCQVSPCLPPAAASTTTTRTTTRTTRPGRKRHHRNALSVASLVSPNHILSRTTENFANYGKTPRFGYGVVNAIVWVGKRLCVSTLLLASQAIEAHQRPSGCLLLALGKATGRAEMSASLQPSPSSSHPPSLLHPSVPPTLLQPFAHRYAGSPVDLLLEAQGQAPYRSYSTAQPSWARRLVYIHTAWTYIHTHLRRVQK